MMNLPPDDMSISVRKLQGLIGYRGDRQGRRLARALRRRHPDLVHVSQPGNVAMTTVGSVKRHAPDLLPKADEVRSEALALLRLIKDRIEEECDAAIGRSFEKRVAPELAGFAAELNRLKALVEAE